MARTRDDDALRKRRESAARRDLTIPPVVDPARRAACVADPVLFLKTYFGKQFSRPFTDQQRTIISSILQTAQDGGCLALAAPRGTGKSTIAQLLVGVYCVITGVLRFPLIAAATGPHATRILGNIKRALSRNELLLQDFPEVCHPIWDLRLAPQRGPSQTVDGAPTFAQWAGEQVILPTVAGSKASGAIISTTGLDAAIRGLMIDGQRPDFILLDDPETRESADSDDQTNKRELLIEEDLMGLGSPDAPLAMVMLTTIMRPTCLSARYTDPQQKPAWRGRRMKLVEAWPDRSDLWDEYITLRQANKQTGDDNARGAHDFYLAQREAMDAGAVVADPSRFKPSQEVSAIQSAYNIIADSGRDHFLTEFNNDPPQEEAVLESGLTPHRVQRQLSNHDRGVIPAECTLLVQGIDVRKPALHWCITAWQPDGTAYVIDYGVYETRGTIYGSDEGLDLAIRRAILERVEETKASKYAKPSGELLPVDMTLIDAGWQTPAVYAACGEIGPGVLPCMGFGKSAGCAVANFHDIQRRTQDKKPGDGWFLSRKGKLWLACLDADRWKRFTHDRFMTAPDKPGRMALFGQINDQPQRLSADEKQHHSFAHHICSESEIEEIKAGKLVCRWRSKSSNNHWLDALAYACAAANIKGIRLLPQPKATTIQAGAPRSMQELAAQAKAKRLAG